MDYDYWSMTEWELYDVLRNPTSTAAALSPLQPGPEGPTVREVDAVVEAVRDEFSSRGFTEDEVGRMEDGDREPIMLRRARQSYSTRRRTAGEQGTRLRYPDARAPATGDKK